MADQLKWPQRVVDKKELRIGYGKAFPAGGWMMPLMGAVKFLNSYLKGKNIGLTFTILDDPMNAHVVLEPDSTRPGLHGQALLETTSIQKVEYLSKITIKIPAKPKISNVDPKARVVGDEIKKCILVHELIHGLGLDNSRHTSDDVFAEGFQLIPGKTGADDKMQRDASGPKLPPVMISDITIGKIRDVWNAVPDP